MNRVAFFALIFCLYGLPSSGTPNTIDCTDDKAFTDVVAGKTAQECHAAVEAALAKCDEVTKDSTMSRVMSKGAEISCVSRLMNTELDKRLLEIKNSSPALFKDEMKLQKNFNNGIGKACDLLNSCNGSLTRITRQDCFLEVIKWRHQQALQVNAKSLKLDSIKKGTPEPDKKISSLAEIKEYSRLLCKMPKEVFKEKKPPADCEKLATAAVVKVLGDDCEDH